MKHKNILVLFACLFLSLTACTHASSGYKISDHSMQEIMSNENMMADIVIDSKTIASYNMSSHSNEDEIEANFKRLSGVYSYYNIQATEAGTLSMNVAFSAKNIWLISVDDNKNVQLLSKGENNTTETITLDIPKGMTRIALIGDNGSGTLSVNNLKYDDSKITISISNV